METVLANFAQYDCIVSVCAFTNLPLKQSHHFFHRKIQYSTLDIIKTRILTNSNPLSDLILPRTALKIQVSDSISPATQFFQLSCIR
jgi:hypothetical protein